MVSALVLGPSGPGSSPGWGHFVVVLGKTLYFLNAQECEWVPIGIVGETQQIAEG